VGLSLDEARVIGRTYGLWGRLPDTTAEVADDLGREAEHVKRIKASATAKIREKLLAMGHPAVASDN
jgi:DNA-directed RNA polymerase sigma subunit (sigma70/sigma32)